MILREIKNMYVKNRLTEGVDFVRKEWLDSISGSAYIPFNETDFQSITMYRIGNPNTYFMETMNPNYGSEQRMYFSFENWLPGFVLYNPNSSYVKITEQNLQFTLTKNGNNIIYKGVSTITINYPMNKLAGVYVTNNMTRLKSVSTSTGQYLPCKLLQDIPASLSINNKAYTANTCGLYYTTTGKFIGNSNLTVEGDVEPETHSGLQQIYQNRLIEGVDYQTYDWLKTTGYAYINTKVKGNQNSEIDVIAIQHTNPTTKSITLYGSVPNDGYSSISFNVSTTTEKNRLSKFGNRTLALAGYELHKEYTIFQSKDILSVNGIVVSNIIASNTFESGEIYLFSTNINNNNSIYNNRELWIKGFTIRNVISLKPCRLLRSIPHNLDAQCKERVAGECGMIDLISGKFYGNVANSGTFTVENDSN